MIEDVRVSVMYQGNDNQWRIDFIQDGEECSFQHIREISLVSMYHSLAKELNKNHGCSFEYSESEITRCKYAIAEGSMEKGSRNLGWWLRSMWGEWSIIHDWCFPDSGKMSTNYGEFEIEEIKVLVGSIGEWLRENDIHQLSYENCKEHWIMYRDSGIIFKPYASYQHLFEIDPDFSPESFEKARKIHLKRVWDAQSENAVTLWNHPDNEVKVEITSKYVKFFRRDDVFSCYTYPSLKDMKQDGKLLMELIDLWREAYSEEDVIRFMSEYEEWTRSQKELPPFPIEQIFNSEYQNYKFHMYE